jgi:hypothetical protein
MCSDIPVILRRAGNFQRKFQKVKINHQIRAALFGLPNSLINEPASSLERDSRKPPWRTRDWPVMKDARSEHIHTTASAISADLPKRPMGWQPRTYLWTAGAPKSRSPIAVSITPGHTALIRIPLLAFSSAAVFVRPITPCLLALLLLLNRSSQ